MIISDPKFNFLLSVGCDTSRGAVINSEKTLRGVILVPKDKNDDSHHEPEEDNSDSDALQMFALLLYFANTAGFYSDLIFSNPARPLSTNE